MVKKFFCGDLSWSDPVITNAMQKIFKLQIVKNPDVIKKKDFIFVISICKSS